MSDGSMQAVATVDFAAGAVLRHRGATSTPVSNDPGVGLIFVEDADPMSASPEPDFASALSVFVPSVGIDSEEVVPVAVSFYDNARARAVVTADRSKLESEHGPLDVIIDRVAAAMLDAAGEEDAVDGIPSLESAAEAIDNVGLTALRRRIREIEAGVIKALSDEFVSPEDFRSLTGYGERLALVDTVASRIRGAKPEVQRRPHRPRSIIDIAPVSGSSFYFKWVDDLAKDARETAARLSALISSQSVIIARRQAQDAERFQRVISVVGATILIPSVVAGMFGANVQVPGQGTRYGFTAMVLLMVAGAFAALGLLRFSEHGALKLIASVGAWLAKRPLQVAWAMIAVAAVAAGAAVFILACP